MKNMQNLKDFKANKHGNKKVNEDVMIMGTDFIVRPSITIPGSLVTQFMKKVKDEYKDDKQKQAAALMELYKKEKVNPLSSCFPMLIQFPFLIAVFNVFRNGFKPESLDMIYSFIERPENLNPIAFGIVDLSERVILFAFLAGAAQYWQTKMLMSDKQPMKSNKAKDENMMAMMNKQMLYFMPLLTVFIGFTLPGGLTFYWFLTTLFMVFQQQIMFKKKDQKI